MPKARILIGKPGLDGHDRGAKYVVHLLRDAGYEVIYTGIRRSPEQIVKSAIQEDVDAIGLSLLSGAHNVLFKRVIDLLAENKAQDIILFGGGTIPEKDIPSLLDMGVKAIFPPGTVIGEAAEDVREKVSGAMRKLPPATTREAELHPDAASTDAEPVAVAPV